MTRLFSMNVAASAAFVVAMMLGGCATMEHHPDIPTQAMMAAEGTSRLAYRAPDNGMVYVYDVTAEQMVYAGEVDRNEAIVVDPVEDRITLDGRAVFEQSLREGNLFRLYFMEEGQVQERVIRTEEIRVEEQPESDD